MIKRIFRVFLKCLAALAGIFLLFFLSAGLLSIIPVHKSFQSAQKGTDLYIASNGMHAFLILPANSAGIDWHQVFPPSSFEAVGSDTNWISFGWGDKKFYTQTPTWDDLNYFTAARALFWPTTSTMHINYFSAPPPESRECVRIKISDQQLEVLRIYIQQSFQQLKEASLIQLWGVNYGCCDNFYEARGRYSIINTCNNWTNKGLKKMGVRAALWAPFDRGVLYQVRRIEK